MMFVVSLLPVIAFAHKQITEVHADPLLELQAMAEQPVKDFNWFITTYQMESIAILLMFGAVAFMLIGKSRNYSIAQSWH